MNKKLMIGILCVLFAAMAAFNVFGAVVINEVMPAPKDYDWNLDGELSSTSDEWVELYNDGAEDVNITGWAVEDLANNVHTVDEEVILEPGRYYFLPGGLTLGNSGDSINLTNSTGDVMDNLTYDSSPGYDHSIGRETEGSATWRTFTNPTPGSANGDCTTPIDDIVLVKDTLFCRVTVTDNDVNKDGLIEIRADNVTLDFNESTIVGDWTGEGLRIDGYKNIVIKNGVIKSYSDGIYLNDVENITITNMQFEDNADSIGISGTELKHFNHTIDTSNTVNGLPFIYSFNQQNVVIENHVAGAMFIVYGDNLILRNNNVSNGNGIALAYTNNSVIENTYFGNNYIGLDSSDSYYNTVIDSTILGSTEEDIFLGNSELTLLNTTFSDVVVDDEESILFVGHRVIVYVNDTNGNPVSDATVEAKDVTNNGVFVENTSALGYVPSQNLTEYKQTKDVVDRFTNYTFNVDSKKHLLFSQPVNITSSGTLVFTLTPDTTAPSVTSATMTKNQYGYVPYSTDITASVAATDNVKMDNVTCRIVSGSTVITSNSSSVGDVYSCNKLQATQEADWQLYFDAYDAAGNVNITEAINFTTKNSTSTSLNVDSITVLNLTHAASEKRTFNVTLTNSGSSTIHAPKVFIISVVDPALSYNPTFESACLNGASSEILVGESCTATFDVTVAASTLPKGLSVRWLANWTDNSGLILEKGTAAYQTITISANPVITSVDNVTDTVNTGTLTEKTVQIDSTGNIDLNSVTVSFTQGTFLSSWLNGFITKSLGTIKKSANSQFTFNFTAPLNILPGTYSGTFTVSTSNGVSKQIPLVVTVNQDNSYTAEFDQDIGYSKTGATGTIATLTINNTGNVDQSFTISNDGATGILTNPSYISDIVNVQRQTSTTITYAHSAQSYETDYTINVNVKPSVSTTETDLTLTLRVENNNPTVQITNPADAGIVSGVVEFTVTATDNAMDRVDFYVDNLLKGTDNTNAYVYEWNTSLEQEGTHTLKAIAYDKAGNYNESAAITVTVDNTQDAPVLTGLPDLSLQEDNSTGIDNAINLSAYASDIDKDSLTYSIINQSNLSLVSASIDGNFLDVAAPAANLNGQSIVCVKANDGAVDSAADCLTITVTPVNDAPDTPTLVSPEEGATVFGTNGAVTLNWTGYDVDGNALTYYVYISDPGETAPVFLEATTLTALKFVGIPNSTTIYWHVSASDGALNSANSTTRSFYVLYDSEPIVQPSPAEATVVLQEGATQVFSVVAVDPDGGPLTYAWTFDAESVGTDQNSYTYTPYYNESGPHTLSVDVTDNNSNIVSHSWTVNVTDNNRAPVLADITDKNAVEDTALTFNITAADEDLVFNDVLTYSSNHSRAAIIKVNNTFATVTFTPNNDDVDEVYIQFTVTDNSGAVSSKTVKFSVENVNDAPVINSYSPLFENPKISEDGNVAFSITKSDVDKVDSLSVKWFVNGTLAGTEGSYTFDAAGKQTGNYPVKVNVSDEKITVSRSWTVTVSSKPIASAFDSSQTTAFPDNKTLLANMSNVQLGKSAGKITFTQNLNLTNTVDFDNYVDISAGYISIDTVNLPALADKTAVLAMKGLSFNIPPLIQYSTDGISWTNCPETRCPANETTWDGSTLTFKVTGFSAYKAAANTSNVAPTITSSAVTIAVESKAYSYDVNAVDLNNDTLTYSLAVYPSGMTINNVTGLISWTPPANSSGTYNVTVRVTDPEGLYGEQAYSLTVNEGSKLGFKKVKVSVDGDSETVNDGNTVDDIKPGAELTFTVQVENLFKDEQDVEIQDISVTVTIDEMGDDDELEEESDEFDLETEENEKVTLDFDVPLTADDATYKTTISAKGRGDNGITYETTWTIYLQVEKKKHQVIVSKAALSPNEITCTRSTMLDVVVNNIGSGDEDEVVLEIENSELGINIRNSFELQEAQGSDDDDSKYVRSYSFNIGNDVKTGVYPVRISTYYDSTKLSEEKTVDLAVSECKETKQALLAKKGDVEVVTQPKVTIPVTPGETTLVSGTSFTDTSLYLTLILCAFIILTGILIFVIGALMITRRR